MVAVVAVMVVMVVVAVMAAVVGASWLVRLIIAKVPALQEHVTQKIGKATYRTPCKGVQNV